MTPPLDRTPGLFTRTFAHLRQFGAEDARFMAPDVETELGLIRSKSTPIDRVGKQLEKHHQYSSGIRSLAWHEGHYTFKGTTPPSATMKGEFYIQHARDPGDVLAALRMGGPGSKPLFSREEIEASRGEALHVQFGKVGEKLNRVKAEADRDALVAGLKKKGAVLSEAEFSKTVQSLLGDEKAILLGFNVPHELMMFRGYAPSIKPRVMDIQKMARLSFSELGQVKTGAFKLENLRGLMEYMGGSAEVREAARAVVGAPGEMDLAKMKMVPITEFYDKSVLEGPVGKLFGDAYKWMSAQYGPEAMAGKAHMLGEEGVRWMMGVNEAVFARAGEKSHSGAMATAKLNEYLMRQSILKPETIQQAVTYKRKGDPLGLRKFMDLTSKGNRVPMMERMMREHTVILRDQGVMGFRGVEGFANLQRELEGMYGRRMANQVNATTKMLSRNMGDAVVFLRKTQYGWTDLSIGLAGTERSFKSLPLQLPGALERGRVFLGEAAREATSIVRGGRARGYAEVFHKALRRVSFEHFTASGSAADSLKHIFKETMEASYAKTYKVAGAFGDPQEVVSKVGKLLGARMVSSGHPTVEAAMRQGLTGFVTEGPLFVAKQRLDRALAMLQTSMDPKDIRQAGKEWAAASEELAGGLTKLGNIQQYMTLTKADNLATRGLLRIALPEAADLLPSAVTESGTWGGHRASTTALRDLTRDNVRNLTEQGVYMGNYLQTAAQREGRAHGYLAERLGASSMEARVALVQITGKAAGRRMRSLFGDASTLITDQGKLQDIERQFRGHVSLPGSKPAYALADIQTLFGGQSYEKLVTGANLNLPQYIGKVTDAKRAALASLMAVTTSREGRKRWREFGAGDIGLTSAQVGDEQVKLGFHTRKAYAPAFNSILLGPGTTRLQTPGSIGKLGNIDIVAEMGIISGAPREALVGHRLATARELKGVIPSMIKHFETSGRGTYRIAYDPGRVGAHRRPTRVERFVMPAGTTIDELYRNTEDFASHLRKKAASGLKSTAGEIEWLLGYKGTPITSSERAKLAAQAGADVRDVHGLKLIMNKYLRVQTEDISKSISMGGAATTQHLRVMMQGVQNGRIPIAARLMNSRLKEVTGFSFGAAGTLQAPSRVKDFLMGFSEAGAKSDIVLRAEGGRFRVASVGVDDLKHMVGTTLDMPPLYTPEGGMPKGRLAGTILDPSLTQKYSLALALDDAVDVHFGGGGTARKGKITHLPVAPLEVSQIGKGDYVRYGADDPIGVYLRSIGLYAEGQNLRTLTGGKGLDEGLMPLGKRIAASMELIIGAARGSKRDTGWAGSLKATFEKGSVAVRPIHITSAATGRATQLERSLAGKKVEGKSISDFYMTENDFKTWYAEQYGKGDKGYKAALRKLRAKDHASNYLVAYVQADPPHTAQTGSLGRLRLDQSATGRMKNKIRAYRAKGEMGAMFDPYFLAKLRRDHDHDRVVISLLNDLNKSKAGHYLDPGEVSREAERELAAIAKMDEVGFTKWAAKLDADALLGQGGMDLIRQVATGKLPKGIDKATAEDIMRRMSGKALPSLPYTHLRKMDMLLGPMQLAKSEKDLAGILGGMGFDLPSSVEGAKRLFPLTQAIPGSDISKIGAALLVSGEVKQAGVKKKGMFLQQLIDSMVGIAESKELAKTGASAEAIVAKLTAGLDILSDAYVPGNVDRTLAALTEGQRIELRKLGLSADEVAKMAITGSQVAGEAYGEALHLLNRAQLPGFGYRDASMIAEMEKASLSLDERIRYLAGGDPQEMERLYQMETSELSSLEHTAERKAKAMGTAESGTTRSMKEAALEKAGVIDKKVGEFLRGPTAPWVLAGGLALGAYGLMKGMFGSEEAPPPPPAVSHNGSPMPPPPIVRQPTDRGPANLPPMSMRPTAKMSPSHPSPIPRHGQTRLYTGMPAASMFARGANNRDMQIQDMTDPISRHVVGRRMREVNNSDFVR